MQIVPARQGLDWLKRGWALFGKSMAAWILLSLSLLLVSGVINLVPWVGPAVATALIPAFSVSFMVACMEAERGRILRPTLLLEGFRQGGTRLLLLGAMYLLSMLLVLGLSSIADQGVMAEWMVMGKRPPEAALRDGSLAGALALAAILAIPVLMAFWFAPILMVWGRAGAAQALFYSFFASLRNWRAFCIYGAVLAGLVFGFSLILGAMLPLLAGGAAQGMAALLPIILVMLNVVMLPVLFGSFYYSYCDVFPEYPPPGDPHPVESA